MKINDIQWMYYMHSNVVQRLPNVYIITKEISLPGKKATKLFRYDLLFGWPWHFWDAGVGWLCPSISDRECWIAIAKAICTVVACVSTK